jgi:hypothetical protein
MNAANPTPTQANEKTVQALLDGVREMLQDESQRGESLNSRGAAVSGFLGIVIALSGTVEGTTFGSGGEYHAVAACLAAAALVALLGSVGLIGWGVLLPSAADAIAIEDVEKFPTYRFITQTPLMVSGYLLTGSVGVLKRERTRNNRKARWLRFGYIAMSFGLLLVSAAGIVLTIEAVVNA